MNFALIRVRQFFLSAAHVYPTLGQVPLPPGSDLWAFGQFWNPWHILVAFSIHNVVLLIGSSRKRSFNGLCKILDHQNLTIIKFGVGVSQSARQGGSSKWSVVLHPKCHTMILSVHYDKVFHSILPHPRKFCIQITTWSSLTRPSDLYGHLRSVAVGPP